MIRLEVAPIPAHITTRTMSTGTTTDSRTFEEPMLRLSAALLLLTAVEASAGCENYTDGSLSAPPPQVSLCFKGECEATTLDYECGRVAGVQYGFANGWRVEASENEKPALSRNSRDIPETEWSKFTCESSDDDICQGVRNILIR